ncbi:MAG TPA: gephyrin-like molybdotransferase Glp, partial [Longimicrobiaceae bacterium]|nr:gephyrin-like molybdotransferase Glp [Longimicrobiaceae bacterium]
MSRARAADWLTAGEALAAILRGVRPLGAEERPLAEALGSVLAEDVVSPVDLPPWDNSGMDGFAVRADDVRGAAPGRPRELRVVDDVPAGRFAGRAVGPGEAIRVMTGAPVPAGADGVVRVEHTDGGSGIGTEAGRVAVFSDEDAGRNVRPRGEDVRAGTVVLPAGRVLRAPELAVAAAVGRARLSVVRRPRVAVLASGDELVEVEDFEAVRAGRKIVSSNGYALAAQLAESGLEALSLGIAADDPASLRAHLERARGCDALVTTAGVSVGEHDHVLRVMGELDAEVAFWRVKVRPGSALAFGRVGALGGIPWFGLPGNPVSTLVGFELFVRPALLRMCGRTRVFSPTIEVTMRDAYPAKGELTHFPRVRLQREADGGTSAFLTGAQGSGVATSMAAADALLVVPPGEGARPGD